MNKTSSIVVAIIIVLFLVGIAYLAGRNSVADSVAPPVDTSAIAPDGSTLSGPGVPPLGGPIAPNPDLDPSAQSRGPQTPPPGAEF